MARPSQNILSTSAIVHAALALVEKNGDFTIPGIAKALKVNPSSLYHHVPGGRPAIVSLVREELYARIALAPLLDAEIPASDRLRSWMRQVRHALATAPSVVTMLVTAPVQDARTLEIYEALFLILRDTGVPSEQRVTFSAMIDAVVLGSALDARSPVPLWRPGGLDVPELRAIAGPDDDTTRAARGLDLAIEVIIGAVETAGVPAPGSLSLA
ncbi:TetR/AcrR family transcriptional regulator (plasmid) [Coraliomargarita sp. W4R53]